MDEKARHFFVVGSLLIMAALVGFGAPVQAQVTTPTATRTATRTATPNPTRVISVTTGHPLAHFYVSWHDPATGALSAVPSGDFFMGGTNSVSIPANAVNIGLLIQVNDSAGWYAGANCVLSFATADNQHVDIVGGAFQASCILQPTAAGLATQSAGATQTALAPTPTASNTPIPTRNFTVWNVTHQYARYYISWHDPVTGALSAVPSGDFTRGTSRMTPLPGNAVNIGILIYINEGVSLGTWLIAPSCILAFATAAEVPDVNIVGRLLFPSCQLAPVS